MYIYFNGMAENRKKKQTFKFHLDSVEFLVVIQHCRVPKGPGVLKGGGGTGEP